MKFSCAMDAIASIKKMQKQQAESGSKAKEHPLAEAGREGTSCSSGAERSLQCFREGSV